MKDGLGGGVKVWPPPNRITFYVLGRGGQSAHNWTTFNGLGGVRQKKCDPPPPNRWTWFNGARTLTPVRVTGPHGARSARHGGVFGATRFFSTLLHGFLCKSDSCEGLILVWGWFLCGADSREGLILVWADCVGQLNVVRFGWCQEKMSRWTVWGGSSLDPPKPFNVTLFPWPPPNRLSPESSKTNWRRRYSNVKPKIRKFSNVRHVTWLWIEDLRHINTCIKMYTFEKQMMKLSKTWSGGF